MVKPLLAVFIAWAITSSALAQPSRSPATFDVLGLRLGLHPDQVAKIIAEVTTDPDETAMKRGLAMGDFKINDILFGYRIKEGKNSSWYNEANKEFIQLNYTLMPSPAVMYITRTRLFDKATAPAIASLVKSIVDKYGPPSGQEGGGTQNVRLYWVSTPAPPRQANAAQWARNCGYELMYDANPFQQMRNGEVNYNPNYINDIWPKCGVSMLVDIAPMKSNDQLAYNLTISIGDYRELQASDHYILDVLRKGAADMANAQAKKATGNAPKL